MPTRPENLAPPEIIYNSEGAEKYWRNSRMKNIQTRLSQRAIEMLRLPEDQSCLVLDIGCGAGLSGKALEMAGHHFIGTDISKDMIQFATEMVEGDMMQHDMGTGLPFRPGVFDGAISISALQWLCNADHKHHVPQLRLKKFFGTLYKVLRRGARAILQFYPANVHQNNLIVHAATKAGFSGGVVVDYPHSTRAKKYYLVLFAGPQDTAPPPKPRLGMPDEYDMDDEDDEEDEEMEEDEEDEEEEEYDFAEPTPSQADTVQYGGRKRKVVMSERQKKGQSSKRRKVMVKGSREWIVQKKEQQAKKGVETRKNTKYTGRRRGPKF